MDQQLNDTVPEFELTLAGKTMSLTASADVASEISKQFGGLINAQRRILEYDFDAYAIILANGLGIKGDRDYRKLRKDIYDTGIRTFQDVCMTFVSALANGGQPLREGLNPTET